MAGPTTEVLSDDLKDLRTDLHKLDVGLAEVRTELGSLIGIAKLGIGLIASTLIGSVLGGIWWAATLTNEVRHLGKEVAEHRAVASALARPGGAR